MHSRSRSRLLGLLVAASFLSATMAVSAEPPTAASHFGINTAQVDLAPLHHELGVGWVRFENMKWPMISPERDVYRYDGTVGPWHVDHDAIVAGYRAERLNVLPFLFLTAPYASSADASIPERRRSSYPPTDNEDFAEFVFQTVARYGAAKHAADLLKTPDKHSGLDAIHIWELWNEPNLTAPSWGPWVGTQAQYFEMFRPAAEAVKRADPKGRVTNGGYAGIAVETVDALRTYRYADGKRPLDFVAILNVHYYSGRTPPEIATVDANVFRSGTTQGERTYEDNLIALADWRDKHKPEMPIWLTETGYDTAGPKGVSERLQAARLPRVIMMALANGIDKVFVYREKGSTPGQHAASGLVRNDGSQKPAWSTYATLIAELDTATDGRRLPCEDPNVRLYRWTRDGKTILSAWTVVATGQLDVDLGCCRVTDSFGKREMHDASQGLALTDMPVYIDQISNTKPLDTLLAQAERDEALRRERLVREAKLRAYLYDFGNREQVGTIRLGGLRYFTTVLADEQYEPGRQYGFYPGQATQNGDDRWRPSPRERDWCRMTKDLAFRFHAAPGDYRLRVCISPHQETGKTVTISGASSGECRLPVTKKGSLVEVDVRVGQQPLNITIDGYADLRWLTLIERQMETDQ